LLVRDHRADFDLADEHRKSGCDSPRFSTGVILKRKRVWIRHYNRADDRETERQISPQRLITRSGIEQADAKRHQR